MRIIPPLGLWSYFAAAYAASLVVGALLLWRLPRDVPADPVDDEDARELARLRLAVQAKHRTHAQAVDALIAEVVERVEQRGVA